MPQVEISDEMQNKLKAVTKLVDLILEDAHSDDLNDYVDLVMALGIERMLRDVLPQDNPLLQDTIVKMFNEKPEFVAAFVIKTNKAGREAHLLELKDKWQPYIA